MKEWDKRLDPAFSSHCYLLAAWSPPMEDIPSLTSWVISMGCTSHIAPAWSLSTGSSPLWIDCSGDSHRAAGFWSFGALLRLQLASGHCSSAPAWAPPWIAGENLFYFGSPWPSGASLRPSLQASAAGATSPSSSSLTSGSAKKILTHFSTSISVAVLQCHLFFLEHVMTEGVPTSLMGPALASHRSGAV